MWIRLGIILSLLGALLLSRPAHGADALLADEPDGRYLSQIESPKSLRGDPRFVSLADLPEVDFPRVRRIERLPKTEMNAAETPDRDESVTDMTILGFSDRCGVSRMRGVWFRSDYLLWWIRGFEVPPLVTSSPVGTPRSQIGVIGAPNTEILYGDGIYHGSSRSGAYLRAGIWFDSCARHGLEGDWFAVGDSDDSFRGETDGDTILARPIHNALTEGNDAQFLPGGTLTASSSSAFSGAGLRYLHCCWSCCSPGECDPCGSTVPRRKSLDFLLGYRFFELRERLGIGEDLISTNPLYPVRFQVEDRFHTTNQFHGSEIGLRYEHQIGRFSLELLGKVGLGNTRQTIFIDGQTTNTIYDTTRSYSGGFLAQRTNMGLHTQDHVSLISELGCTVGWALNRHVQFHFGYTFLFWGNVVRPGDQIDMVVNPNLFPPEAVPFTGPLRPAFNSRETEFWAQGMHLGVDCRW